MIIFNEGHAILMKWLIIIDIQTNSRQRNINSMKIMTLMIMIWRMTDNINMDGRKPDEDNDMWNDEND